MIAIVLLLLWQPGMSIATLKPQQNIVAVLLDDSKSMGLAEDGSTRREEMIKTLEDVKGMKVRIVNDGEGGWTAVDNASYVPRPPELVERIMAMKD